MELPVFPAAVPPNTFVVRTFGQPGASPLNSNLHVVASTELMSRWPTSRVGALVFGANIGTGPVCTVARISKLLQPFRGANSAGSQRNRPLKLPPVGGGISRGAKATLR